MKFLRRGDGTQSLGGEIVLREKKDGWKNEYRYIKVCLAIGSLEVVA